MLYHEIQVLNGYVVTLTQTLRETMRKKSVELFGSSSPMNNLNNWSYRLEQLYLSNR